MPDGQSTLDAPTRQAKRRRILRAAIEVFARKGYFAARMTDVAKAADVADGTLYLYFEGKEHLLISVFDDFMGSFVERLRTEVAKVEDPIDKLRKIVSVHLETLGADRELAHVMQIETRHSRRFMNLFTRGGLGEYFQLIREIVEEGQRSGTIRDDIRPGLAINVVFGAVDEAVTSWLLVDEPGELIRHQEALLKLLCEGMASSE